MILDEMPVWMVAGCCGHRKPNEVLMGKLATAMKNKELSQEAKEGELEVAVQELLGDDDGSDMFITPTSQYITKGIV